MFFFFFFPFSRAFIRGFLFPRFVEDALLQRSLVVWSCGVDSGVLELNLDRLHDVFMLLWKLVFRGFPSLF